MLILFNYELIMYRNIIDKLSNWRYTLRWFFLLGLGLWSCSDDPDSKFPPDSLAAYIESLGLAVQADSIIACATSSDITINQEDPGFPIEIIFYPLSEVSDIRYYESSDELSDVNDYSQLERKDYKVKPLFNGYLRKFVHPGSSKQVLGVVTFIRNGKLFISNAIRIKISSKPTEYSKSLVTVNQDNPLSPVFTWMDGFFDDNVIYFHVVSDQFGNLISGTYTIEKSFRFYNLDNVVLNIRNVMPPPELEANQDYTFTIYGVSDDNWVNLIAEKEFTTN